MPTIRANIAASELLTRLRECQVELWVANGSLRYRAPTGAFTPELRACVASLRTEITEALSYAEMTAQIAKAIGKELAFRPISDNEARERLIMGGAPPVVAEASVGPY
jgi:hypothetical protein